MVTAAEFNTAILAPALVRFHQHLPSIPVPRAAQVMLLAIAGQESAWKYHLQQSAGSAAHGYWQFERMGGVNGVLTHPKVGPIAAALCKDVYVQPSATAVWGFLATAAGDYLATAFARLLLWTDPAPLPTTQGDGWSCYTGLWRPGKPRPHDWPANYQAAAAAVP